MEVVAEEKEAEVMSAGVDARYTDNTCVTPDDIRRRPPHFRGSLLPRIPPIANLRLVPNLPPPLPRALDVPRHRLSCKGPKLLVQTAP